MAEGEDTCTSPGALNKGMRISILGSDMGQTARRSFKRHCRQTHKSWAEKDPFRRFAGSFVSGPCEPDFASSLTPMILFEVSLSIRRRYGPDSARQFSLARSFIGKTEILCPEPNWSVCSVFVAVLVGGLMSVQDNADEAVQYRCIHDRPMSKGDEDPAEIRRDLPLGCCALRCVELDGGWHSWKLLSCPSWQPGRDRRKKIAYTTWRDVCPFVDFAVNSWRTMDGDGLQERSAPELSQLSASREEHRLLSMYAVITQ